MLVVEKEVVVTGCVKPPNDGVVVGAVNENVLVAVDGGSVNDVVPVEKLDVDENA